MAKPVPAINEPFVGLDGRITDVWYKYLLSLGYSDSNDDNGGSSDSTSFLKFEFDDHIRNNLSWLRADTFSWQDGEVYVGVYEHLLEDIEGKELQSETIGGITIQYYLADDMHKICPATEEIPIMNLYNNIGIAWYYIIDTVNQRFKLPRTQNPYTNGTLDFTNQQTVTMPFTAPADGWFIAHNVNTTTDVYINNVSVAQGNWSSGRWSGNLNCQIMVKAGDVVTGATGTMRFIPLKKETNRKNNYKYLYFYVGDADSDDVRKIASANLEKLNSKADTDLHNIDSTGKEYISHLAMPSDTYDDLTLGVSGTTYTAPADGFFTLNKLTNAANQYANLVNETNGMNITNNQPTSGSNVRVNLSAKKGEVIKCSYSAGGTTVWFRFVYAEGSV